MVPRRITHPHGCVSVARPQRQVFRHALDEPTGQRKRVLLDAAGNVYLKRVRDLMTKDVIRLAETGSEWQRDPRLHVFSEPANALTDEPASQVGLREMRMGGVENERLSLREGVVQDS